MKRLLLFVLTILVLTSQLSCDFTTLYPIFTTKDLIFKPGLLGFWKPAKKLRDSEYLEIERLTSTSLDLLAEPIQKIANVGYLVTKKDFRQNIISRHAAFLVEIGSGMYLDLYPMETEEEKAYFTFFKNHYVRMHSIYRIEIQGADKLELKEFDGDFVENLINTNQIRIRHEQQRSITNVYIITASTEELQSYLIKYADDPRAYAEKSIFEYKKLY